MDEIGAEITLQEIKTEALLENILRLDCRTTYNGDYNAVDKLLDLDAAMKEADLTDRQRDVLRLYYIYGYTHKEIGERLCIARRVVGHHCGVAIRKIVRVYANWEKLEEDTTDEVQQT